jgi:DNA polymerase/3'-5' exonuclease PolX
MKVDILVEIIETERNARIDKSNPSSTFIFQAYSNIVSRVKESFSSSEAITPKKIDKLKISDGMKEKLKKMLNKKIFSAKKKTSTKKSKKVELKNELVKYLGLGVKKADVLIKEGLTSAAQLTQKKYFDKLPLETRTIIKTKPLRKISHENIKAIEKELTLDCKHVGNLTNEKYKAVIVGSYRRKSAYSRDIDVMIVSDSTDPLEQYLKALKEKFTTNVYSKGLGKMSLVLKGSKTQGYYKLDAFVTSKKDKAAMLLYSTGPKMFNIKMRAKAKAAGYLLNQEGLHSRKTNKKIEINSEKDLFTKLKMAYVDPEKR